MNDYKILTYAFMILFFLSFLFNGWQAHEGLLLAHRVDWLELNQEIYNLDYCQYVEEQNTELQLDIAAKNSLFINHCKRTSDPWACGLGAN